MPASKAAAPAIALTCIVDFLLVRLRCLSHLGFLDSS
jgi:hypothetical protein